jgi:hypothetical protein
MVLIKFNKEDGRALEAASGAMAAAAVEENKHKKAREAAKTIIARELLQRRGVNLDNLPAKEIVLVQCDGVDVLKVERKESQRLDGAALGAAHPELVIEFTKPSVASYFSSLVK